MDHFANVAARNFHLPRDLDFYPRKLPQKADTVALVCGDAYGSPTLHDILGGGNQVREIEFAVWHQVIFANWPWMYFRRPP